MFERSGLHAALLPHAHGSDVEGLLQACVAQVSGRFQPWLLTGTTWREEGGALPAELTTWGFLGPQASLMRAQLEPWFQLFNFLSQMPHP